jgi:hypothetical protein
MAWAAIEAFVNSMSDDFASLPEGMFQLHERALLQEKRIKFKADGMQAGTFVLDGTEHRPLEEKIVFLLVNFGKADPADIRAGSLWNDFQCFKKIRDRLMHPRRDSDDLQLDIPTVESFIEIAKQIISLIAQKVWSTSIQF